MSSRKRPKYFDRREIVRYEIKDTENKAHGDGLMRCGCYCQGNRGGVAKSIHFEVHSRGVEFRQ